MLFSTATIFCAATAAAASSDGIGEVATDRTAATGDGALSGITAEYPEIALVATAGAPFLLPFTVDGRKFFNHRDKNIPIRLCSTSGAGFPELF